MEDNTHLLRLLPLSLSLTLSVLLRLLSLDDRVLSLRLLSLSLLSRLSLPSRSREYREDLLCRSRDFWPAALLGVAPSALLTPAAAATAGSGRSGCLLTSFTAAGIAAPVGSGPAASGPAAGVLLGTMVSAASCGASEPGTGSTTLCVPPSAIQLDALARCACSRLWRVLWRWAL
jgi:hypothetical protein